jgi:uncharacterized membrane protein YheB (UPF0754 family)
MSEQRGTIWMPKALANEVMTAVALVPGVTRVELDDEGLRDSYPMITIAYYFDASATDRMELAERLGNLLQALDMRRRTKKILSDVYAALGGNDAR